MNDSMLQNVTLASSTDLYQDVNYSVSAAAMIPAAGMPTVEMPTNGLGSLIRESLGAKLAQQGMVKVEVSELLDTFRVCFENHLQWIEDFRDDSIWITQDLHEVIEAFENMRREMMP
jgi:hypothetical protein